jgi:hypothetical protein
MTCSPMPDTMARQDGFSDYAHVAALDPATGTPPGAAEARTTYSNSVTPHGAHDNQSCVAVPIVLDINESFVANNEKLHFTFDYPVELAIRHGY